MVLICRRPGVYTALSAYLFPIRIYEYRKKHYSLFLADLCCEYGPAALVMCHPLTALLTIDPIASTDIVNIMCLAYIWIWPSSTVLFVACYCLSHGPLCTAIATWRNSLVFHSVDKVTSLFIHIYPPFVFTVLRHLYPNVEAKYPALAQLPTLNVWRSLVFSSVFCEFSVSSPAHEWMLTELQLLRPGQISCGRFAITTASSSPAGRRSKRRGA